MLRKKKKSALRPEMTWSFVECFLGQRKVGGQIVLGISAEGDMLGILRQLTNKGFAFPVFDMQGKTYIQWDYEGFSV